MASAPSTLQEIITNAEWYDKNTMQTYIFNIPTNTTINKITILIESTASTTRGYGSNEYHTMRRNGAMRVFYPQDYEDDYEQIPMMIIDELRKFDYSVDSIYGPNVTPDTGDIYTRLPYEKIDFREDITFQ